MHDSTCQFEAIFSQDRRFPPQTRHFCASLFAADVRWVTETESDYPRAHAGI